MYMFTSLMLLVLVGARCVGVVLFIVLAKCLITVLCIYIAGKDTQDTKYCIAYISNILYIFKIQRWCVVIDEIISCDL